MFPTFSDEYWPRAVRDLRGALRGGTVGTTATWHDDTVRSLQDLALQITFHGNLGFFITSSTQLLETSVS